MHTHDLKGVPFDNGVCMIIFKSKYFHIFIMFRCEIDTQSNSFIVVFKVKVIIHTVKDKSLHTSSSFFFFFENKKDVINLFKALHT